MAEKIIVELSPQDRKLLKDIRDAVVHVELDSSLADAPRRLVEAHVEVNADVVANALKNGTISELGRPNYQ